MKWLKHSSLEGRISAPQGRLVCHRGDRCLWGLMGNWREVKVQTGVSSKEASEVIDNEIVSHQDHSYI